MHEILTRYIPLCGIVVSTLWGGTTFAEERLVMPFSCQSSGGKVVLNPAPPQSYRIFGDPEHQRFTTCSPNRPALCRNWMVHRFELDCNGARVSWLTVVDAFTKLGPGRASVSNGRLHLRMGPWWNGGSPAPCDMRPPFAYGPYAYARRSYGWPCPRPSLSAQETVVDMPAGFAPFLGPFARLISIPEATNPAAISEGAASQRQAAGRNPSAERVASDVADGTPPPSAAAPSAKTAPMDVAGNPPKAGRNIFGGGSTASLPKKRVAPLPRGSAPTADLSLDRVPMTSVETHSLLSRQLEFALAIALLLALLFASARRLGPIGAEVAAGRPDAAQPSFTPESVVPRSPTPGRVPDAEWLPSNRNEALQVLGASSETAHDILKKTVRTLRQTWHPDLARREEERRVRGLRLKQINVAWDIICGKQASA